MDAIQVTICYGDDSQPVGTMVWKGRVNSIDVGGNGLYDFSRDEGANLVVQLARKMATALKALEDR
ncbi:MAG: hypothetical protein OXG44_11470 [Gammaproteobacteria bacterium]|nr:hypothetical protein [Gammaproteobacteria bacterium]